MRAPAICGAAVAGAGLAIVLLSQACEEVLEVCPPCGDVAAGESEVSGDPRIDGTLAALQRIRLAVGRIAADYGADLALLTDAFGLPADSRPADIKAAIMEQLSAAAGVEAAFGMEPARCFADVDLALEVERTCEKDLDCNLTRKCLDNPMLAACIGLYRGPCGSQCEGRCLSEDAGADGGCPGECQGRCEGMESQDCPGACFGACSGACSAYDSAGGCAGRCAGLCTGACESEGLFACNGSCAGSCAVDAGTLPDSRCLGTCLGECRNARGPIAGSGTCRGHTRPTGCDAACADCREMAKMTGWSALACRPAIVRVGLSPAGGAGPLPGAIVSKGRILERALARMANDQAIIGLLVDGVDAAGELDAAKLVEDVSAGQPAEYLADAGAVESHGVPADSRFLPLLELKARIGLLSDVASKGGYTITASSIACLDPALADATDLLERMLPTTKAGGVLALDRSCAGAGQGDSAPCLFGIIDGQAEILSLFDQGGRRP